MNKRRLTLYLILLVQMSVWSAPGVRAQTAINDLKPTLILISIDGFRADYLTQYHHPTIDALRRDGVSARWMTPSYPSLTFPNHYTIVTGLYPEHSGIVSNNIHDPEFETDFATSKRDEVQNGRWWGGEPIWITAEKAGLRTSATLWPGSEATIKGRRPTYFKEFDDKIPAADRVDGVLSLLDLPADKRPTFLTLYFSDVDHAGHDFSPKSAEVAKAIDVVDASLARLIEGLRARNIYHQLNLIVVSDHGMTSTRPESRMILDDYFNLSEAKHIVYGADLVNIFPKDGDEERLFRSIKHDQLKHARCYRKRDIPARFHYRASRRIGAIVCMADEGWRMSSRAFYEDEMKKPDRPTNVRGAHGYDNQLRSMRAIFIARGPAFRRRTTVRPFPNIDVYNVMARVLGIKPAKNDGHTRTVRVVLR